MRIYFASKKLQKEFESEKALKRSRGETQAKKIRTRLLQLEAAANLAQLRKQPGKFHELKGDRMGTLSCSLDGSYRLIFEPADIPKHLLPDGGLDWERTISVRILEVVDYHD